MARAVGYIGGMPNNRLRKSGKIKPTRIPAGPPQTNPQSRTGICMGNSILPILGICAVKNGRIRPRTIKKPDKTNLLVDVFFMPTLLMKRYSILKKSDLFLLK